MQLITRHGFYFTGKISELRVILSHASVCKETTLALWLKTRLH